MRIDVKKAFSFPFSDEKWIIKILIGGLLSMVPVVNFFAVGYLMRILKECSEGKKAALPEWTDWENLFKEGFFGFLIGLIYIVGVMIVMSVVSAIPIIGCIMFPVTIVIQFAIGAWLSIAIIKYIETKNFNEAFNVKAIYEKIKCNLPDYALVALITSLVMFAGSILFCLLFIPVFYAQLVAACAFGDLYYVTEQAPLIKEKPAEDPEKTEEQ